MALFKTMSFSQLNPLEEAGAIQSSQPKCTPPFTLLLNHSCVWMPLGTM